MSDTPVCTELATATQEYLAARLSFHQSSGVKKLREFRLATDRLFAAFSAAMPNAESHVLADAFHKFRRTLVQQSPAQPRWRGSEPNGSVQ